MRKILGNPAENHGRGAFYVNSDEILKRHLETTGGKFQLRFPPEPNGFLHIGHAKAMSINFGIAKANNGVCYLRLDDTNPEAEKQEYIDAAYENCSWLGHDVFKYTFTSDYFDELYEIACKLILRGKAYVSRLNGEQVTAQRNLIREFNLGKLEKFPTEGLYDEGRDTLTPEENLKLFEDMRAGKFKEGEVTLRMKGDWHSKNPNMWDHMAYRIIYKPHPRTGDKWCIYPTYDFSHCLVDSLENITHSLCTLEFETRQKEDSSYHWLLDALDMYHPKTWESSRCSISYNVMSKRRLNLLVTEGYVKGWDDPRLLTIAGLKRRGYTPTAINNFCTRIGIARSSNEVCVSNSVLEASIRNELDLTAQRRFAVFDPLEVIITNFDEKSINKKITIVVPNHPSPERDDMGSREIEATKSVFIPNEKFRLEMVKGFKGMVPGSTKNTSIRLANFGVVTYENHIVNDDGKVTSVSVKLESNDFPTKGLSVVTWVSQKALKSTARIYDRLFVDCMINGAEVHAEKAAKEKNVEFTELFNKNSLQEKDILVEPGLYEEHDVNKRWQFMTVGYFCIDSVDSTPENPIYNMVVSLKESKTK